MESTRQWLLEIALAGFGQLDAATVMPFVPTLEELQRHPELKALAAVLTGLVDELLEAVPTATLDELPLVHWVDLWCRAVVRSFRGLPRPTAEDASGSFEILGVDLKHHEHLVSLVAHGLLGGRYVRSTVSTWKVDAVAKAEIWKGLAKIAEPLLGAVSKEASLEVKKMPLWSTGDLVWRGGGKVGKKLKLGERAGAVFGLGGSEPLALPAVPPVTRHPVQLAIPLHAEASVNGDEIALGDATLPIAKGQISPEAGLDGATLKKTKEAFGLLRFDAGAWAFQPLWVSDGKKCLGPMQSIAAGLKGKTSALGVLQERATHLLRKS